MSPVSVYALLGEPPEGPLPNGASGEPMRVVECGGITAAVGDVEATPSLTAEALRAHDTAVRALGQVARAVLPARFGSVLEGDAAVRAFVGEHREDLGRALELVDGCVQMTLRVYTSGRPPAPARADPAGEATGGKGTRYLRERAAAPDPRRVPALGRALEALSPLVRAEKVEAHEHPPLFASVYHLVERSRLAEYQVALADVAAAESGEVTVRSSGPWPAYAFAPGDDRA